MTYSINWIERINRDNKRTTRKRGELPNPGSTILLSGYVTMTRKRCEYKMALFRRKIRNSGGRNKYILSKPHVPTCHLRGFI